jgi:hypothetical protein
MSAMSAMLGLVREIYVVHLLGLGPGNDSLQLTLSVVYTISILGEPLRLASLNLLDRRLRAAELVPLALAIIVLSVGIATYLGAGHQQSRHSLTAATIAGLANLGFAAILPRFQQRGRFLRVHAVTVLPSVLILAGLLLLNGGLGLPVASVVIGLFLAAPIAQLGILALMRDELAPIESGDRADSPGAWVNVGAHSLSAVGAQLTQLGLRSVLLGRVGWLTAFVLTLRAADTFRAVIVDTYAALQVRRWASAARSGNVMRASRTAALIIGGCIITLGASIAGSRSLVGMAIVTVGGVVLGALVRVAYLRINTAYSPRRLILAVGFSDLAIGVIVLGVTRSVATAILPTLWAGLVGRQLMAVSWIASGFGVKKNTDQATSPCAE